MAKMAYMEIPIIHVLFFLSLALFIVASVILLHLLIYMYCLSVYHDKTLFIHK